MQTVASLAERLEMTAEEAVRKLRHMLFDVENIDSVITDEQCDLLIDIDDDESLADRIREARLKDIEKEKQRTERLKEAARKAAAKRKAVSAEKAAEVAKKKPAGRKKKGEETEEAPAERAEILHETEVSGTTVGAGTVLAEIIHDVEAVEATAEKEALHPAAEIIHEEVAPPAEEPKRPPAEVALARKPKSKAAPAGGKRREPPKPAIKIGVAAEHEEPVVQVLRADGTLVAAPEVELTEVAEIVDEEEEEVSGVLAEAERRQEEEEKRKAKQAARPLVKPDPAVVAEVQRKAAERKLKLRAQKTTELRRAGLGKTARKRQKKVEKARAEEKMRKEAAAVVREVQAFGPTGMRRRKRRRTREEDSELLVEDEAQAMILEVEDGMTVEDLADEMDVPTNDIILALMDLNILATKNQTLSLDVMRKIAEPHGYEIRLAIPEEDDVFAEDPDDPDDLKPRAPVITVMGHVDHGKTTLLDRVRKANVAEGEVGGITQHIAAYEVQVGDGRVVFLDTPGHEAFTQMRSRGAQITDVVVLVVAADDGVMPQTVEAIDHAKAAEVPIVVAVNKCDKPGAQPERIRQELIHHGLMSEDWGGTTIMKNISAKMGQGVDELMELLVLEAQLLELKANPGKRARGVVIESEISRGQGPVAWVLVQRGTLRVGDIYIAGRASGRVRAMLNSRGEPVQAAGPATPVVVTGFSEPPDAGDQFVVVADERIARAIAFKRTGLAKQRHGQVARHITLEDFHAKLLAGEQQELHIVIKGDVQGSVDVLQSSLAKLGNEEVRVHIVHAGVGGINESDVLLAGASDAVIIGFHVTANARAQKLAEQEGVDIRTYRVIYEAIDDVRRALEGMLAPETREVITGHVEVRQVFRSSALGSIAGCQVIDGEVVRGALVRIGRDGVVIHEGKIASLRRLKDDVRSVQAGFECGIKIENFDDVKVGDTIETYQIESIAKTLA